VTVPGLMNGESKSAPESPPPGCIESASRGWLNRSFNAARMLAKVSGPPIRSRLVPGFTLMLPNSGMCTWPATPGLPVAPGWLGSLQHARLST